MWTRNTESRKGGTFEPPAIGAIRIKRGAARSTTQSAHSKRRSSKSLLWRLLTVALAGATSN
jgi:hypothetical protein